MSFIIKTFTTRYDSNKNIGSLIAYLKDSDDTPLIACAKQQFLKVLGENVSIEAAAEELKTGSETPEIYTDLANRTYRMLTSLRGQIKLNGDIFPVPKGSGLLYLRLSRENEVLLEKESTSVTNTFTQLEIGYLGDENNAECL